MYTLRAVLRYILRFEEPWVETLPEQGFKRRFIGHGIVDTNDGGGRANIDHMSGPDHEEDPGGTPKGRDHTDESEETSRLLDRGHNEEINTLFWRFQFLLFFVFSYHFKLRYKTESIFVCQRFYLFHTCVWTTSFYAFETEGFCITYVTFLWLPVLV